MIQATFKISAPEFTPEFFEQIRQFLRDSDAEVFVQVRRKAKRVRKGDVAPQSPDDPSKSKLNGQASAESGTFTQKYPSQPTPDEGLKRLAALTNTAQKGAAHDVGHLLRRSKNSPPDEARVLQIIDEMNVQEPIDELLALLTP